MEESDFKSHALRAETMMRTAEGTDADYWRGYLTGTRRAYHGEAFGTEAGHGVYVRAASDEDEQRRRLGEGYRDAMLRAELVSLRHAAGLSQPEAGRALDRSAAWVRSVEQGRLPTPLYAVYAMRYLVEHPEVLQ